MEVQKTPSKQSFLIKKNKAACIKLPDFLYSHFTRFGRGEKINECGQPIMWPVLSSLYLKLSPHIYKLV